MKYLHYLIWIGGILALVIVMTSWAVLSGFLLIPAIIIPLAVIVIIAGRRLVSPVLDDELNQRIHGDAAMRTIEVVFITGVILMCILFSQTISTNHIPKVSGHLITNDDTTRSMTVTIQYQHPFDSTHTSLRSFLIRNIETMTYKEAGSYARFWQEGFRSYYDIDLSARIIGSLLLFLLLVYGFFYVYYRRRY